MRWLLSPPTTFRPPSPASLTSSRFAKKNQFPLPGPAHFSQLLFSLVPQSYLDSPPDHLQQCRAALAVTETLYTQAFGAYATADVLIKQRRPLLDATAVAIFKVAHMVQKACVAAAAEKVRWMRGGGICNGFQSGLLN